MVAAECKSSRVMGKSSNILEKWNEHSEIKSKLNSLNEQSEYIIQTPFRCNIAQVDDLPYIYSHRQALLDNFLTSTGETKPINERVGSSLDDMSEDIEQDASSRGQESGTNSRNHGTRKKGTHNTLAKAMSRFRIFLSSYLKHKYYDKYQSLNEISLVHSEKKQTFHKLPVKTSLLRLYGNIAGRRHELRHLLQKFLDSGHSQSSQSMLFEMDLAYEIKLEALWTNLQAAHQTAVPFHLLKNNAEERASEDRMTEEEEMNHEWSRLSSFHGVNMNVSYLRLAAAGFYATKDGDETRCFSCGLRHRNWQRGDNPFVVHTNRSPTCKHLNSSDVKKVPIQLLKTTVNQPSTDRRHQITQQPETADQDDVHGATGISRNCSDAYKVPQSFPTLLSAPSTRGEDEAAPALSFEGSVHPHYSSTDSRLESFKLWPEGHSQRPEELVRAGFFYAGYADCVRCFVCGVGLRTWEEGDDPWTEHVRWRSSCAYVEAVRGKRFIMQTLAAIERSRQPTSKIDRTQQPSSNRNMNRDKGEDILRNTACTQAMEMGFSREKVEAAARATVNPARKSSLSLDVLLETILVTDGEVSEQREADLPMEREVPGKTQANVGSCPFDTTQELSRIPETPTVLNDVAEKRRSSNPQRRQTPQRPSEDKDTSSDSTTAGAGMTSSSLVTKKADKDSLTSNPQRKEYIVTGRRIGSWTNVFYNDNDSPSPQPGVTSSTDTISPLGDNKDGRNIGDRPMDAAAFSMPTGEQRPQEIDKTKNKFQHKGKSKEVLKATADETRQLKESSACKICLENTANILFLPCGHIVACVECAPALERCPVCRKHIRGTIRVHMVSREKHIAQL